MKVIVFAFFFLSAGVIYANYYIAQQEEQKSVRFIVSQAEGQKNGDQKNMVANILSDDVSTSQKTHIPSSQALVADLAKDLQNTSSTGGQKVPSSQDFQASVLTSAQSLSFVKSVPGRGITSWQSGKAFTFEFSDNIDIESFFANFVLTPSVDGKFSGEMNYGSTKNIVIVNPVPKLTAGTKYTLTLKNGVKSFDKTKTLSAPVSFIVEVK